MQMLNVSCSQTVMAEKWDCLARAAGADVELFISLRADARFCPGKRGWSKWACLARLAGAKFKKKFGGLHKKMSSMAKTLKSKSKPLLKKIKEKAGGIVGKLKSKVSKEKTDKVASGVKKQAKKAGKKTKLKNMVKAGAIGTAAKKGAATMKGNRAALKGAKRGFRKGKGLAAGAGKSLSKSSVATTSANPYVSGPSNVSGTLAANSPYVTGPSNFGQ